MMVVDHPRRWQLAIAALAALVLLLAVVFIWQVRHAEEDPGGVAATAVSRPGTAGPVLAAAASTADAASPITEAATGHGADQVEVCGGAWVTPEPDGLIDWAAATTNEASQAAMRARVVASLRSSPDAFAQASALVEGELFGDREHHAATLFGNIHCIDPVCEFSEAAAADVAQARDHLARMAVSSTDPRLYALALDICALAKPDSEGACQLLNPRQWAKLEPGNAAPWLMMLESASNAGNEAGIDEALHQIATAMHNDRHATDVARAVIAAMPDDDASLPDAVRVGLQSFGTSGAYRPTAAMLPLVKACSGEALRDVNRAQTCDGVAELLVERSDNLLARAVGTNMGERLGWPTERIERLRGEITAWSQDSAADILNFGHASCLSLRRSVDRIARRARLNETGSLRQWVTASGRSPADFVKLQQTFDRAAQAARVVPADQPRSNQTATQSSAPTK